VTARRAPDGSPVDLYARLARPEVADLVHARAPRARSVLDLGSGPGHVARRWLPGAELVLVDQSSDMLALGDWGERIVADAQTLDLGRTFDVVLLLGCLVSIDALDPAALLATAARHVAPDGVVVVERFSPAYLEAPFDVTSVSSDHIEQGVHVLDSATDAEGRPVTDLAVSYAFPDGFTAWHRTRLRCYDDARLARDLEPLGLRLDAALDDAGCLLALVPEERA
jgi:SAM-dependent methyltransferase